MRLSFAVLFALISACFTTVRAQDSTDLDPVTVTASMSPERASRTGRNLIVIKGESISNLPVHSVDELLRYVPGLEVQARGPFGAQSDIVLRGGTFQQVLVILDGVRLNDPNTGHFSSYVPIAPAEIARIEVLKGASSAIYGSEAVGGVIHIITKAFAATSETKTQTAQVQLTGGEYNLLAINAGGMISNGKSSFAAGILSNNTAGQLQRGTRGYVHAHTASASFAHYFAEKWQLALRLSYDDRDFGAQNFYTTFLSDTATERVKNFWNQLQLQYKGNRDVIRFSTGYKHLLDHYRYNGASAANESRSELWQSMITHERKLSGTNSIVSGIQFINKSISSNDRGDHSLSQAAGFVVLNQRFSDFQISPALRLEWNERAGWEWVPQANVSFRKNDWQIRGSIGKTIRDADFTERYNNYNKALVTGGRIGNPDLVAERSLSYEAGADYFAGGAFKLSATFFQRRHDNLIDYAPTPFLQMPRRENLVPTGSYALAKNIAEVTTTGFETDLQYSKNFTADRQLWATVGFTRLHSLSSDSVPSFYVSSHARYLANFNIRYSQRFMALALNGLYKNRTPQQAGSELAAVEADYFLLNAKAEASLFQKKLIAFIEADNLLNTKYSDLLGAAMPGRWLMTGLKITLYK